jgi:hypothetical protein
LPSISFFTGREMEDEDLLSINCVLDILFKGSFLILLIAQKWVLCYPYFVYKRTQSPAGVTQLGRARNRLGT